MIAILIKGYLYYVYRVKKTLCYTSVLQRRKTGNWLLSPNFWLIFFPHHNKENLNV